jgi:6-phosphogluconolactonase
MRLKNSIRKLVIVALVLFFAGVGAANTWAQSGGFAYVGHCSESCPPSSTNNVSAFTIDGAGALTPVPGSPFTTGSEPVGVAVDPTGQFVYVANGRTFAVSAFRIDATNGALTPVPGSPFSTGQFAFSVTVDPTGQFVYVASEDSRLWGYTIDGGSGALTPVPGSPFPNEVGARSVVVDPTGQFVYVANCGIFGCGSAGSGSVSAYAIDSATGALTAISGSPFAAGTHSSSVAVDPTGSFVYVANMGSNDVSAYTINAATGALTPIAGSPFPAGPSSFHVAVDPTGQFAYVANCGSNFPCPPPAQGSVSAYTIDPATGALTPVAGSPFATNGMRTGHVTVDWTGQFVYATNTLSGTVSAFVIDPANGALAPVSGSPFAVGDGAADVVTTPGPQPPSP